MATLSNHNGRRSIQFPKIGKPGRFTIRLGKIDRKGAEGVRSHIDHLISHAISRQPIPRDTASWLADIDAKLHAKLAKAGLIASRAAAVSTELEPFTESYIKGRTDLKPRTIANLKQVQRLLVKHFGAKRSIQTITRGEMGDWNRGLKVTLATATVAMHVKKARQMFADAVDRNLIATNPVKGIKAGKMSNPDRQFYIPEAMAVKVIDACPDAEWRLIFALARFGGLRTPSETHRLRWTDIRWDEGRFTVRSPKTEHHEGKATREVPIFPELLPYLRDALEVAEDGAVHVCTKHRGDNLRTQAERIIEKAGVVQWPKMFQNLRSSRETDLTAHWPLHVVVAWMGNTELIALTHYLQVTDEHFESAAKSAVDRAGQERTETVLQTKKPRKHRGFLAGKLPPRGVAHGSNILAILRSNETALQKALHRLEIAMPHIRRADAARLEKAVRASAPAATGGQP